MSRPWSRSVAEMSWRHVSSSAIIRSAGFALHGACASIQAQGAFKLPVQTNSRQRLESLKRVGLGLHLCSVGFKCRSWMDPAPWEWTKPRYYSSTPDIVPHVLCEIFQLCVTVYGGIDFNHKGFNTSDITQIHFVGWKTKSRKTAGKWSSVPIDIDYSCQISSLILLTEPIFSLCSWGCFYTVV